MLVLAISCAFGPLADAGATDLLSNSGFETGPAIPPAQAPQIGGGARRFHYFRSGPARQFTITVIGVLISPAVTRNRNRWPSGDTS